MGDVELVDLKFVDRNPVVVVQFTCQQINCTRDRFGNVVEGGPQDVQRVYYYWALQQDDSGDAAICTAREGMPIYCQDCCRHPDSLTRTPLVQVLWAKMESSTPRVGSSGR